MDAGFRTGMGWFKPHGYFMGRLEEVAAGYVPDGAGIVHKNARVAPSSPVYVDDDLVLHLIKQLHSDLGDRSFYRST